jgi:hypothetical protein
VAESRSSGPDAGIAEALICVALACGAISLVRDRVRGRGVAQGTVAFAIVGFLIGLSFTVRGGDAIDIAYHATVLPLLLLTPAALLRPRPGDREDVRIPRALGKRSLQ